MALGIPVITNAGVGDVEEIIIKYEAGFVLENLSGDSMRLAVQKILDNPVFNKRKIKQGAEAFYSLERAVQLYKNVYDKILQ